MKILMLTDSLVKGGRERRLIELLKGLRKQPEVSCELVSFSKEVAYPAVFELGIPLHFLERRSKKDPRVMGQLYSLCRRLKPDLIHSWGSMSAVFAAPVARLLGIKFVNAMIADAPKSMSWSHKHFIRSRLTFPFSDAIVGNSYAGLKAYKAPPRKSHCLHNGFDFQRIDQLVESEEIRKRLGIQTPLVVGMVGAFADRKDYRTYLQAAIRITSQRKDVSFLAIGDGKNRAACQAMVPAELQAHILFTGLQNQVESIVDLFQVGVLCTNPHVHGEGISNAILEYMALAKPVVATYGGGTPELVLEGETGCLVEPENPDALAEGILMLLNDPELARQMGQRGRDRVKRAFNLEDMTAKYLDLYRNTILVQ